MKTEDYYDIIQSAARTAAPLFNMYGWTYLGSARPTENDLEDMITSLVDSAIESIEYKDNPQEDASVSSGRFTVRIVLGDHERFVNISLELAEKYEEATF